MSYQEDHRHHMAYEINRQDRQWVALNRRQRKRIWKNWILQIGTIAFIAVLLWLEFK